MTKKRLIIFDFDGVLADSFDTFYPLIRNAMRHVGIKLTANQYRDFFTGNVHQGFKDFINNEGAYLKFQEFRNTNYDKYYYDKKFGAKLFSGAPNLIKKLSKKYNLTICSSGKKDNIRNLLKKNKLDGFFDLILANFSHSKEEALLKLLKKFKTKPEETFMITDTVGDIKVAKKVGLMTIAVTWGFHNKKLLLSANPNHTISNFDILEKLL